MNFVLVESYVHIAPHIVRVQLHHASRVSSIQLTQIISKPRPRKRAPATKSLCQRQLLSASFAQPIDRHGCLVRKSESLCASNLMKHRLGLVGMIWSLKYVATEAGSGMTRFPRAVYL